MFLSMYHSRNNFRFHYTGRLKMRDMENARNAEYVKPKVQKRSDGGIQLL